MGTSNPYVVSTTKQARVPAPKSGRDSLFIQNNSAFTIYIAEDSPLTTATISQAVQLGGGLFYSVDQTQGRAVPQGTLWILGSNAGDQAVVVKEG